MPIKCKVHLALNVPCTFSVSEIAVVCKTMYVVYWSSLPGSFENLAVPIPIFDTFDDARCLNSRTEI